MQEVHEFFTGLDWTVVVGYLLLTTLVGHLMKGRQATIRDFFLGGRTLPWTAVCGSIIATEISALTFIGVPGMVFAANGNFTYLQWAIGSIIARFIVGLFLVKVYYEREIYSPYDFMEHRLGPKVKVLTTFLFFLGSILGQSVRVLVTAIVLKTVTGLQFELCILAIGLFAVIWTWMGGMRTVIWTDVMQFFLFLAGGLIGLICLIAALKGGWAEFVEVNMAAGKFKTLDLTSPLEDPAVGFTLWVAILAMPFQNLAAFGTDQLMTQRMFCCRNHRDAAKAVIWSSVSQVITIMMLLVGAGLFAYYQANPPGEAARQLFDERSSFVFPVWITMVLPAGLSGLILAGAFAAAISSLDSVLAALSQTSLSLFYKPMKTGDESHARTLLVSRISVVLWGIALSLFAIGLNRVGKDIGLIDLAFGMVTYTYGPMLGILLAALVPRKPSFYGLLAGMSLSVALVLWIRPDLYTALGIDADTLNWRPQISYAWLYPVTCFLTFGLGYTFGKPWNEKEFCRPGN